MASTDHGADGDSIMVASLIMIGIALLIGWTRVVGPAVAGYIGGREVGSPGSGLVAGLVPAVIAGILVGVILALFDLPIIGTVTGFAVDI